MIISFNPPPTPHLLFTMSNIFRQIVILECFPPFKCHVEILYELVHITDSIKTLVVHHIKMHDFIRHDKILVRQLIKSVMELI